MEGPKYISYSLEELKDAFEHIDKKAYPDRVREIEIEIARRKSGIPAQDLAKVINLAKVEVEAKKGKKSARGLVLAIWPATVALSVYFGLFPSRNGFIDYREQPLEFVLCLIVYIGVGFYFYHSRESV